MLRKTVSIILSLLFVISFPFAKSVDTTVNADTSSDTFGVYVDCEFYQSYCRSDMLNELNSFRTGDEAWYYNVDGSVNRVSGLASMRYDYSLEKIAMQRAAELAIDASHYRPNGQSIWSLSYDGVSSAGENICGASGFGLIDSIAMWKETDQPYEGQGHRRIMLSGCNAVGLAVVRVGEDYFGVLEVANIDPQDAAPQTPAVNEVRSVRVETKPEHISGFTVKNGSIATVNGYSLKLDSFSIYAVPAFYIGLNEPEFRVDPQDITWLNNDPGLSVQGNMMTALQTGRHLLSFNVGNSTQSILVSSIDPPSYASPHRSYSVLQFVSRLYSIVLEREGDVEGLADWTNKLLSGEMSGKQVADGFFYSSEFESRWMTDKEYLTLLYHTFFNREPDEGGMNTWMNALYPNGGFSRRGGATWEDIYKAFCNSQEWKNLCNSYGIAPTPEALASMPPVSTTPISYDDVEAFVTRLYTTCLQRDPDPSGLEDWFNRLVDRSESGSQVAYGFFFSDEFIGSDLDDEEFVTRLYHTFFDREPDPGGFADWIGRLAGGATRKDVFDGFAGSQEWIKLCESYGIIK